MKPTPYMDIDGCLRVIFDGAQGPKGQTGKELVTARLTYANVSFSVEVDPSTVAMIEDENCLNIGDLDLIEVVNKDDWSTIREEWCKEWQMIKARRAFAMGDMEDDSF